MPTITVKFAKTYFGPDGNRYRPGIEHDVSEEWFMRKDLKDPTGEKRIFVLPPRAQKIDRIAMPATDLKPTVEVLKEEVAALRQQVKELKVLVGEKAPEVPSKAKKAEKAELDLA